jgi:geranylgeranyl diphosphate synthase type II
VEASGKGDAVTKEQLDFIYRLKTGALIEASMMIGAILAGASEEEVSQIEQIAGQVGLAFQIQDDILDVTSTTEELGKPVLSDEKNEKTTYVTLEGLEKAKEDVQRLSQDAIGRLDRLPVKNEFLRQLILELIDRKK